MRKYGIPFYKRHLFHPRIGINVHRKVWLFAAATAMAMLIAAGEEYMLEHDLRLTRDNQIRDMVAYQLKPTLGAPGTTKMDWQEGTTDLKVGKLK